MVYHVPSKNGLVITRDMEGTISDLWTTKAVSSKTIDRRQPTPTAFSHIVECVALEKVSLPSRDPPGGVVLSYDPDPHRHQSRTADLDVVVFIPLTASVSSFFSLVRNALLNQSRVAATMLVESPDSLVCCHFIIGSPELCVDDNHSHALITSILRNHSRSSLRWFILDLQNMEKIQRSHQQVR